MSVMTKPYDRPYVRFDAGALAGAVVCTPTASVDRLPPLQAEPWPIAERALEQHNVLIGTLRSRGVEVTVLEPQLSTPTEPLIGDCVVMLEAGAVVARPSSVERRHEAVVVERALTALGIPVIGRIEAPGLLDACDVAVAADRVFVGVPQAGAGLRARSNELGRRQLAAIVEAQGGSVVELAVAPAVARLRNVFNLVAADTIVAAPDWVDLVPVRDMKIVEVPRGEEYAAEVLAFGERRVIANLRFRESVRLMRRAKIEVEAIDLWEFGKAGIGPSALVLAVKRG
jgi:dimethylargininase